MYPQFKGSYQIVITSLMNDTSLIDLFVNTQNSAKNLAIGDYKRSSVISGDWSFFKVSIPEKGYLNIQVQQCLGKNDVYWTTNDMDLISKDFKNKIAYHSN